MKEIWNDVQGFEGLYQVSSWGKVRNQNKILKPYKNKKGYLKIDLFKDGKRYKKRVNRLVAEAFIDNPYGLSQVNHKDGNCQNNSISNLEWCSAEANIEHAKSLRRGIYKEITHTIVIKEITKGG